MKSWDDMDSFSKALVWLGGIAGFLWGGAAGSASPEGGFWAGAFVGMLMGAVAGGVAGALLEFAFRVLFALVSLGLVVLRIYLRLTAMGS